MTSPVFNLIAFFVQCRLNYPNHKLIAEVCLARLKHLVVTCRIFELVARYCEAYNNLIPIAFVLGFFVAIVVERWNIQFSNIPWPDRLALFVTASVRGADERGRMMRRTIMRYVCLSYVITMASISPPVKKRFPTLTHITDAGNEPSLNLLKKSQCCLQVICKSWDETSMVWLLCADVWIELKVDLGQCTFGRIEAF